MVEVRGDEVFAVFGSAAQAVRAALELQATLAEESAAAPSNDLLIANRRLTPSEWHAYLPGLPYQPACKSTTPAAPKNRDVMSVAGRDVHSGLR